MTNMNGVEKPPPSDASQLSPVAEGSLHIPKRSEAALTDRDRVQSVTTPKPSQGHARLGRNRSSSSPLRRSSQSEQGPSGSRRKSTLHSQDTRQLHRSEITKLSPAQIYDLTSAPDSLPVRPASPVPSDLEPLAESRNHVNQISHRGSGSHPGRKSNGYDSDSDSDEKSLRQTIPAKSTPARPSLVLRSSSNMKKEKHPQDGMRQRHSSRKHHSQTTESHNFDPRLEPPPSPFLQTMPIPPASLPTYLQLELSSDRPSPLYIHRPASSDTYYESSKVKFERLLNFLRLPPYLEQLLFFGALACLDSWLYTFTVLPLRFAKSLWLLLLWATGNLLQEAQDLAFFVWGGLGRLWRRARGKPVHEEAGDVRLRHRRSSVPSPYARTKTRRHRRHESFPSSLQQNHKADLLQGLLIITSCMILMRFDASRMYHNIRGQAVIKLYVIYNVLEVFDRLFAAVGQDILECLFSKETLERKADGRSKVLRPLWMFLLALVYTVTHSAALFYQVITLNVAVNSYSNALLTLLMSNQFVEIKGSVFKKFEKENLFQLTCADVVERFQLWLMLLVIALRNIVEVGGLSISTGPNDLSGPSSLGGTATSAGGAGPNATNPVSSTFSILPDSFTLMPTLNSFQVLSPFALVLGSEMLVDWLKHAYITKFNATSPRIYARFLDILAKDYYSHAFVDQNLTRRLGLPVIPLACLFIRAAMQTYHMFLAINISPPSISTATSLSLESETPASSPVLAQLDQVLRRALGHSSFGGGATTENPASWLSWSADDVIALTTMLLFFLALYLVLLALKLALGMVLLSFARKRYAGMKEREQERFTTSQAARVGGYGAVEVGEERRKTIYEDSPEELRSLREKERSRKEKAEAKPETKGMEGVERYSMVAKRIW